MMYGELFRAATRYNTSCSNSKQNIKVSSVESNENTHVNRFNSPVIFYITDCSKAVLLVWFSVFDYLGAISVSVLFSLVCLDDI